MLNPLMMMLVLTLVFSHLFRFDVKHYPVYVLSGTLIWNLFAQSSTASLFQLVWGGALLNRIYLPRTVFALSSVGTGLVNLLFALFPLAVIMFLTGVPPSAALLFLPVAVFLAALFTLGIGLFLSALAVSFTDVTEMYQIILYAWYFLTPIMYPVEIFPESSRAWFELNPMLHLMTLFRGPILDGTCPTLRAIALGTALSVGAFVVGWLVFTSRSDRIAYHV
jgi:ABC-type polysaccharide/polyol phosphate export permease